MTVKEALIKVRDEVLVSEDAWTQGCFAQGAMGNITPAEAAGAVRWCLMGAVFKVVGFETPLAKKIRSHLLSLFPPSTDLAAFNDAATFTEVRAVLDKAIEACK